VISRLVRGLAGLLTVAAVACWPAAALADERPSIALPGEKLEGSTDAGQPTEIEAGTWRGTVGPGGSSDGLRYYAYHRTMPDSTVHVSLLGVPPVDSSADLGLKVSTPDGEDCQSTSPSVPYEVTATYAVGVRIGALPSDAPDDLDACDTSDTLYIAVDRGYSAEDAKGTVDISLTVVEEARVKSAQGLPQAVDDLPDFTEPDVSSAAKTEPAGATSYDDAPLIESGAYAGSLDTGKAVVYRVHVGWGQTLNANLTVNQITGADAEKVGSYGPQVGVGIVSPMFVSGRSDTEMKNLSNSDFVVARAVTGPVRFLNREEDNAPSLPGDYYVVVGAAAMETGTVGFDYTLKVDVTGAVAGEPAYGTVKPFVTGDGAVGDLAAAGSGGWTAGRLLTVAGLSVFGVASLGGGVQLLRRR
jgi:Ca-activated chloride channel family protein